MLKLSTFEFFARSIPESLVLIYGAYAFSKRGVDGKKYIISTVLLCISVFIIRSLPINYGVHTILNIIMIIIIVVNINKIDTINAIKSSIVTTILLFACEGLNIMILRMFFGNSVDKIIMNPVLKTIYSYPSLIFLAVVVTVYYRYLKGRGQLNYD